MLSIVTHCRPRGRDDSLGEQGALGSRDPYKVQSLASRACCLASAGRKEADQGCVTQSRRHLGRSQRNAAEKEEAALIRFIQEQSALFKEVYTAPTSLLSAMAYFAAQLAQLLGSRQ